MFKEYVENKIRDALKKNGGNALKARQQIIAWTYEDAKLLHALTRPHLNGIVAYQVERILSGRAEAEHNIPAKSSKMKTDSFGMEILKAVSGGEAAVFGQETGQLKRSPEASKHHVDAIMKIASVQKSATKPENKDLPEKK